MKLFACLIALASVSLAAQSLTLAVTPATVAPGGTATLTVTFTDAVPSANISGLQWHVVLPAGVGLTDALPGTSTTSSIGASAIGAKTLSCDGSTQICLLAGSGALSGTAATLNDTAIATGLVATIPITVSATATAGAQPISLSPMYASSTTGSLVALPATSATLTIAVPPCKYCVTGDTVISQADVNAVLSQAEGVTACVPSGTTGSGDVNADGLCNVQDVVMEIEALEGLIH